MHVRAGCELAIETDVAAPVIAMLRPRTGRARWHVNDRAGFDPALGFDEYLDGFGNRCQRFTLPPGLTRIRLQTRAVAAPDPDAMPEAPAVAPADLPASTLQFLLPSRYCPSDRAAMYARALEIVGDAAPGHAQVEAIRRWIHDHLAYRYGVSDASTDAQDTLAQGAGVCRDFAHVGMTLCRALDIPARMVVGWLHDLKPMDMHAWFEAYLGDAWHTFDATQATPRGGRVVIAHGRDAADVAFLTSYRPLRTVSIQVWTELDAVA
ncbi:transglutaminase family protein [Luteimonas sp. RC10]|jgi:transglutaminase-like putative cysteine protease|uniref:transglutaminase-like domain-containing protein n=1 Tax=Luteimonas sp. RC10 TaxID=2587035 RepID=UPI00160C9FE1|nr:transglutaminase family protein [Luteimonas sp. RC10]MBB3344901.1 transglutaminase-like putative cysteine protease [Luteimonas sp. RC10]